MFNKPAITNLSTSLEITGVYNDVQEDYQYSAAGVSNPRSSIQKAIIDLNPVARVNTLQGAISATGNTAITRSFIIVANHNFERYPDDNATQLNAVDIKNYSDTNVLDAISILGNAISLGVNIEVGSSTQAFPATFFSDQNRFIGMNMANSDDKLSFILRSNSTTTFGAFENGFAINGNIVAYPTTASTTAAQYTGLNSTPFIFCGIYEFDHVIDDR